MVLFEQEYVMQLMLILGIVFAIGAVWFALQNTVSAAVTLALWQFEGGVGSGAVSGAWFGCADNGLVILARRNPWSVDICASAPPSHRFGTASG